MAITRPALTDLDATAVAAQQAALTARLQAAFPSLDFRRGVFHDLVLYLSAVLAQDEQVLIDLLSQSQSIYDISANPLLADPTLVDRVLSNFRVVRNAGQAASGPLTLIFDSARPTTLAAGMAFSAGGVRILVSQGTAIRTSDAQVTSASDRVLVALPDGTFSATVPAAAADVGTAGLLRRGTAATPDQPPPAFVKAYAESDWSGGVDADTNAALIARLKSGISALTPANRATGSALVLSGFPYLRALSWVGSNDPELLRASRGTFAVPAPGYCDLHVQAAARPAVTALTKTATLVQATPEGGVWQLSIGRDDAPGFHEVAQVIRQGTDPTLSGYAVTSDVRGLDTSGLVNVPDVRTAIEGAYSRYQTATIRFLDTDTPTGGLTVGTSTAAYTVAVSGQPSIADVQAFLSSRSQAPLAGDVLVRGAVPCAVRVGISVAMRPGTTAPDAVAIADAAAGVVAGLGFSGVLYASRLAAAVAPLLPDGATLSTFDLLGLIRAPGGQKILIRDPAVLTIPNRPADGVTPRTTAFSLDPADVSVSTYTPTLPEA